MAGVVFTVSERCKGCGACVKACPEGAITLQDGRSYVNSKKCKGCGTCILACSNKAKKMRFLMPSEAQIRSALRLIGRLNPDEQLDCGACGFPTCRDKAIATCQGISSPEACLPSLVAGRIATKGVCLLAGARGNGQKHGDGQKYENGNHEPTGCPAIVAYSPEMDEVLQLAGKVARVNSTVLLLGESGVGKEVVARFIHRASDRRDGPFVKINCGAIPETLLESELFGYESGAFTGARREGKPGLIEVANNGILFLDEISELPFSLQVKLLQVLQERQVVRIGGTKPIAINLRVMAATNRDLAKMVKEGAFRADLFYRLNVVPITIPPLRQRKDDIIPLAYHFLERFNEKYGRDKWISEEAKEVFLRYEWPGNVRELENLVERLVVTVDGSIILPDHLPEQMLSSGQALSFEEARAGGTVTEGRVKPKLTVTEVMPLKEATREVERQIIEKALEKRESTYKIAKLLGVNQSTVVRKIQKYMRKTAEG